VVWFELGKCFFHFWHQQNRFVVYSQIIQLFEIVDYIIERNDTFMYSFACKDNNGLDCTIQSLLSLQKSKKIEQLYITYDDHIIFIQYI
jgi:hypothetical protein